MAGPTTGSQSSSIDATNTGLCPTGQTSANFVATVNGSTTNYTWSCNGLSGGNCSASYTPGGGTDNICQSLTVSPSSGSTTLTVAASCSATIDGSVGTWAINCGNGQTFNTQTATCTYGSAGTYTATCAVDGATVRPSCTQTVTVTGGGGGGGNYCGDGIVQRPNSSGFMEQCDAGVRNGQPGVSCSLTCTMGSGGGGGGGGGGTSTQPSGQAQGIVSTNPGHNDLSLSSYNVVVGAGAPIFRSGQAIKFTAQYPIYADGVLAVIKSDSPLVQGDMKDRRLSGCIGNGTMVHRVASPTAPGGFTTETITCSGDTTLFPYSEISHFVGGSTASFGANESYRETDSNDFTVNIGWLAEPIHVRLSKPIVSNTAGGNAYLSRAAGNNVNEVVNTFLDNLRKGNFTTAAMVDRNTISGEWSATKTVGGTTSNNTQTGSISAFSQVADTAVTDKTINNTSEFDTLSALGDNQNIRVLPSGNLTINSTIEVSGVKTILVKNGNLIINSNITYADANSSVAFVVENGDIQVDASVTKISGVFIAMQGKLVAV